ncbi:MAG: helix-hairpin-helix domain-containing protein [Clostridium sp.]
MNEFMNNKSWRIENSLWVILSFVSLLSGLQLIYIGLKVNNKKWKVLGMVTLALIYAAAMLHIIFPFISFDVSVGIFAVVYIWNIIYSFAIREEYLRVYSNILTQKIMENNKEYYKLDEDTNNTELKGKKVSVDANREVNDAMKEINSLVNKSSKENDVSNKIDINTCDERTLIKECGTNIVIAKRAIKYREEKGGFKSIDEFIELINVAPSKKDEIRRKIKCEEIRRNIENRRVRRVDF